MSDTPIDEPGEVEEPESEEAATAEEAEEAEGTVHGVDDPEGKWHVKPESD